MVRAKGARLGEVDDRTCLKDTLLAILPADKREDANLKMSTAMKVVPADRDAFPPFGKLGYVLGRASGDYSKKGSPTSLLVLQDSRPS